MKYLISSLAVILIAGPASGADLSIAIGGHEMQGEVRLQLHASAESLQQQQGAVMSLSLDPRTMPRLITLSGLPDGPYAVAAYQDRNGNGQLDRSFLGRPQEPYAFSNDQRSPDFAAAAVVLGPGMTQVSIRLH